MRRRHEEKENGELSEHLVILVKPEDVAAEAYRTLRTNLLYAFADNPPKVIVVSSPGPEEGKSTTCANLAVALAQAGKEVLIIDGDLRAPVLHKYFGLRNVHGLVSVLTQQCNLEEAWHELTSELKELKILTAGPVPYNPTELLSSQRFAEFAGWVREDFDYILFDAPPVGLSSDAAIAATHSDGVLLVIDSRKTRKSSVRRSMRSLEAIGVRVLGTVMNNVEVSDDRSYGGSYAYKSGSK
jgi:receptor protein-tyrosine kinase